MTSKLDKAARSFFVLAECTSLLKLAHDEQRQWDYEIKEVTINGPDGEPERDGRGMPRKTGGYEINIVIHPPAKAPAADVAVAENVTALARQT